MTQSATYTRASAKISQICVTDFMLIRRNGGARRPPKFRTNFCNCTKGRRKYGQRAVLGQEVSNMLLSIKCS